MLKLERFTGINNVQPTERLKPADLAMAKNVDIGLDREIRRRAGYAQASAVCHKNLWQARGYMLATCNGDLVRTDGITQTLLQASIGVARVWYCNLPDGRTAFSNGLVHGITDGTLAGTTGWGVPIPDDLGAPSDLAGQLFPGTYRYSLTYRRQSDGLEGAPAYSEPFEVSAGGLFLAGLPERAGYDINVYLSSHNGAAFYFAGTALGNSFTYLGKNDALTLPCRTDFLSPMPAGKLCTTWRSRVLVADGPVLLASMPHQPELVDMRRDFKQFSHNITLIQPVDGGIFVGTEAELAFLAGSEFDTLVYGQKLAGRVVLGSGALAQGELIQRGNGLGTGDCMVCIVDGLICTGFADGGVIQATQGRYKASAAEVAATFRVIDGIPQYVAVVQ